MTADLHHLDFEGRRLAYRKRAGSAPTLFFLPGYASDMDGSKAVAIDAFAECSGLSMLRFDYSCTGLSGGNFAEGTLDRWIAEALAMLDELTEGPVIVIGSSMGGWIALHLALQRPGRVTALVGIAAAPDFTDWGFSDEQRAEIERSGRLDDDGPGMSGAFWRSGQQLLLLEKPIAVHCPVRLLHGENDTDVPLPVAYRLLQQLRSADLQLTIIKSGGHRLSEPNEIDAILHTIAGLVERVQRPPQLPR